MTDTKTHKTPPPTKGGFFAKLKAKWNAPVVAVIRLNGVIGQGGIGRKGLTLDGLSSAIDRAFAFRNLKAVALEVNSPGGSPVQSDLIAGRIRALAAEKNVPVIAFCEDVAASGGYWIACAADEIYAMPGSILGSIGVVSAGFGFVDAIDKLGVERRVHTAGKEKAILDPFQPEKPADIKILKRVQGDLHDQFKNWVSSRREGQLNTEKDLFTGAFWTGREAVELGLADGIGNRRDVLKDRFGEKTRFRPVVRPKSKLQRLFGMEALADAALDRMNEQVLRQRLGL